jgi:hypothetical protein
VFELIGGVYVRVGGRGIGHLSETLAGAVSLSSGGGDSLTLEGIGSIDFAIGHTLLV